MKKKIAVLGANYQYLSFYKQAKELGYEIYAFSRAEDDHVSAEKYADHYYDISFKDKDRIIEICLSEEVDGVTSFLIESALPYVNTIARCIGSPCNPPESEAYTADKYTMREQLKKEGVNIPLYKAIKSKNEKHEIPYPIIVKPADSGGSRGVSLVRNHNELNKALDRAFEWSSKGIVMIEQYVEGREFSIESISYKGKHYILQITDKVTTESPYFVEIAHHQPAILTDKQWSDICILTTKMLTALKVENGASHTEIKMDSKGIPFIIEMGPRMGGDFISSDLVRLSTGYNFVGGVLEIATGSFTEPKFSEKKCSGVYFLCKETKEKVITYIENYKQYPFIIEADIWGEIKNVQCNSDRAGYFIYQNDKKVLI